MPSPPASTYFQNVHNLLHNTAVTDGQGNTHPLDVAAERAAHYLIGTRAAHRKVILVGNGGSASIAGHMEMDLCNRADVRAVVFNDPPVLTALANDHGYEVAYERLLHLHADQDDVLVAISSSGQSENILRAVRAAQKIGCFVLTLSGFKPDNPLRSLGDLNFFIESTHYGLVEVAHHALGHFLTDYAVEDLPRRQKLKPDIHVNGNAMPKRTVKA
jgi:D-sedoheptulose 7-phosphate isomerase